MRPFRWALGLAAVFATTTIARAQTAAATPSSDPVTVTVPAVADSLPRLIDATPESLPLNGPVAVLRQRADAAPASIAVRRAPGDMGPSVVMMVVGGAALVTGAVIGGSPGTVFMVGGAVIGLVGLYHWLR